MIRNSDMGEVGRSNLPIVVLVATTERRHLHQSRTIPSLLRQTRPWDALFVVDDTSRPLPDMANFWGETGLKSVRVVKNKRTDGAAGTWNTGLDAVREQVGEAWIAILDDDDEWLPQHLETCHMATALGVDAVISGITTYVDEVQASAPRLGEFTLTDFLHQNPGWQGSNTFVKLSFLEKAGRFDESLACTHDRDLAIRLLEVEGFRYARTAEVTVKYHIGSDVPAYTRRDNPIKLKGLSAFWGKHRHRMTREIEDKFFERASDLFGFRREQFHQYHGS